MRPSSGGSKVNLYLVAIKIVGWNLKILRGNALRNQEWQKLTTLWRIPHTLRAYSASRFWSPTEQS
ncbi:MAG: hypothetical protein RQ971_02490 [Armatimonadota bacterium]|nr:hypothetical protein [Armatimonadota bacterium]